MTEFTPVSATLGGLLIGSSAALLLLAGGRVAGISGILGGALAGDVRAWRVAFIVGLPLGAILVWTFYGPSPPVVSASPPQLILAGLLVGFGTRLGSGCTSGHGICGVSRGSPRSIAATATFMTVAAATVFVMRHVIGGAS
jgi:uncharacterized membrane protein YedE/YeeE